MELVYIAIIIFLIWAFSGNKNSNNQDGTASADENTSAQTQKGYFDPILENVVEILVFQKNYENGWESEEWHKSHISHKADKMSWTCSDSPQIYCKYASGAPGPYYGYYCYSYWVDPLNVGVYDVTIKAIKYTQGSEVKELYLNNSKYRAELIIDKSGDQYIEIYDPQWEDRSIIVDNTLNPPY